MVGLFQVLLFATFAMKFWKPSNTSLHVTRCMKKWKMKCAFVFFSKTKKKIVSKIIAEQSNLSP